MEPAHFGEREATTDRGVSVAGNLRAGPLPDIGLLDGPSDAVGAPDAPVHVDSAVALGRALVENLSRVLLGTPGALTAAAMAALSGGHLLIEDVPGVGKTVLARALAASLGAELSRVQGHPDLLPSDVTGVSVYAPDTSTWEFRPGPVFAHVVLVDELNRTPPRTQAALLETMEEQQVSVDGESWPLPRPHLVIATQNPFSQLGTYPLVESQLDRFALATAVGYPDPDTEARLVRHGGGKFALGDLQPVCTTQEWLGAQRATETVVVSSSVAEYAVALCRASRGAPGVRLGASPRGDLVDPRRPGPRRPLGESIRHPRRREGGGRGLPGAPPPHRRGRRAGCRRGPGLARLHTCPTAVTTVPGRGNPVGATTRRRRVVMPVRPLVPLASCAGVLLAWGLVAHNSGAGWVQAVGDVLAGTLAVGLVAPAVVAGAREVTVVASATDATAGLPTSVLARATTRIRVRPLDPPGPASFVGPHRRPGRAGPAPAVDGSGLGPGTGPEEPVTLIPPTRGVFDAVVLEVSSAAPFGLLWWRKRVVVALPRQLHVGPRLGRPLPLPRGQEDTTGGGVLDSAVQIGVPRGVRPYRPGDHRRWVHWPATADSGELMVREMEGPTAEPVTLEVRLPADPEAAEAVAEQAMGTVVALVDRGASVLLATTEDDGPALGTVGDRRSAGRRLARAVAEPGGDGRAGTSLVTSTASQQRR